MKILGTDFLISTTLLYYNKALHYSHLSCLVRKPTICIGENKGADQLLLLLLYLNPKFQASSSFLCLYRSVCVRPVRKPLCWFSNEVAHLVKPLLISIPILLVLSFHYNAIFACIVHTTGSSSALLRQYKGKPPLICIAIPHSPTLPQALGAVVTNDWFITKGFQRLHGKTIFL